MKVYTYSQARQNLAELLSQAQSEDVLIRRRSGGETFHITAERREGSPFDVDGIKTTCTTSDVLSAVRSVRER